MKLDAIWVVTLPTKHSGIEDIVFRVTPCELVLQVRGGLSEDHEPLFFTDEAEARAEGERRLAAFKAFRNVIDGRGPTS